MDDSSLTAGLLAFQMFAGRRKHVKRNIINSARHRLDATKHGLMHISRRVRESKRSNMYVRALADDSDSSECASAVKSIDLQSCGLGDGCSPTEARLLAQRRLTALVRDSALQLCHAFDTIISLQSSMLHGARECLAAGAIEDEAGTESLLTRCSALFEECEAIDSGEKMKCLYDYCDQAARALDAVLPLMCSRDEAIEETRYYEEKLAALKPAGGDLPVEPRKIHRFKRNQEKLARASADAQNRQVECNEAISEVTEEYGVQCGAMLHSLVRLFFRGATDWGSRCSELAKALEREDCKLVGFEEDVTRRKIDSADATCEAEPVPAKTLLRPPEEPLPALTMLPSSSPCAGGIQVEVRCPIFHGPIDEVLIGGASADILMSSSGYALISVPESADVGDVSVQVRASGRGEEIVDNTVFSYHVPISFGLCGKNIELLSSASHVSRTVAWRSEAVVDACALTAKPLPLALPSSLGSWQQYYFEVRVLEVATGTRTTKTLSLGFVWLTGAGGDVTDTRLPDAAKGLRRSIIVGGELPRVHLGGVDAGRLSGWRPIREISVGTTVGAFLEVLPDTGNGGFVRITVSQDGVGRFASEHELPSSWVGAPHGVVDVAGTVRRVELVQGARVFEVDKAETEVSETPDSEPLVGA